MPLFLFFFFFNCPSCFPVPDFNPVPCVRRFFPEKRKPFSSFTHCQEQIVKWPWYRCDGSYHINYTNIFPSFLYHLHGLPRPTDQLKLRVTTIIHPFSDSSQVQRAWKRGPKGKFTKYCPERTSKPFSRWLDWCFLTCDVRSVYDSPSFTEMLIHLSKIPLCSWVSWILEIKKILFVN